MDQEHQNPVLLPRPSSPVPRPDRLLRGLANEHLLWLGAVLLIGVLLLAACGSSGAANDGVASLADEATATPDGTATGDEAAASPTSEKDPEEAMLAYTDCMRANGVDMPDPQFDEDGNLQPFTMQIGPGEAGGDGDAPAVATFGADPNSEEFKDAQEACGYLMEGVTLPGPSDEEMAAMEEAGREFAQCMRDEGFDVPDPIVVRGDDGPEGSSGQFSEEAEPVEPEFDPDDPEFKAAQEKCEPLLENARPGSGD